MDAKHYTGIKTLSFNSVRGVMTHTIRVSLSNDSVTGNINVVIRLCIRQRPDTMIKVLRCEQYIGLITDGGID